MVHDKSHFGLFVYLLNKLTLQAPITTKVVWFVVGCIFLIASLRKSTIPADQNVLIPVPLWPRSALFASLLNDY